jgi:hypothetical protein
VTDPIKPGQFMHMGLKSETLSVQLASVSADIGLSSFSHFGTLPEDSTTLDDIGVIQSFETSERRRPITGEVAKSILAGSIVLTKTSNSLGEKGVYELKIPITPGNSVLAYFKFRKKSAWTTYNPDWCNLTNMVGMYFGVEHGTFNTAAYAFLRDNGSGGSIVFCGPLQSYNTARPGQTELATDLDPVNVGSQGWMSLADNAVIEFFIRINTYTNPFRAELWTRIASTPAPVFQGSIPLGSLGQFPNSVFTNSRSGTSETATLFFGNIGRAGDVLQVDDWALFPDFRANLKSGTPPPNCNRLIVPDVPILYRSADRKLPSDLSVARWFPVTGPGTLQPDPELFYQPGTYLKPAWMSLTKSEAGIKAFKRTEPRLETQSDGFMVEAFLAGTSTSRVGDLIGPGFVVEDGTRAYRVIMLETSSQKLYGLHSSGPVTASSSYYLPDHEIDFRSLKLVRLTVDRLRSKVYVHVDNEKVIEAPLDTRPQINSGVQAFPVTNVNGNDLIIDVTTDGGVSWNPHTHTFSSNPTSISAIVSALNGDAGFVGAGPSQIEALDRGNTFAIRAIQSGPLMGIRINGASSAVGVGGLNMTIPSETFGESGVFPSASDTVGKVVMGHPLSQLYDAELKLSFLNYMTRYLAWESEDSLVPDSVGIETARRFTLVSIGVGSSDIDSSKLTITKADFSNINSRRYYKKDQSLSSVGGVVVDFGFRVTNYTNHFGQVNAPNVALGAGVVIFLGDKRVFLNLYDCGLSGKRIGVIPGSGSEDDILHQTELGLKFSAPVDWTRHNVYRLSVRSFHAIELWAGSVAQDPIISIPWRNDTDGFDLPSDFTSPGVAFGHFHFLTPPSSTAVEWTHFRWGFSNGYEMALQQKYPDGMPKYLFGGRAFILTDFDEA